MSAEVYIDYLLFCKEGTGSRADLYFVEFATLRDEVPHIERFAAEGRLAAKLSLGDLCSLRATSRRRLLSAEPSDAYDIEAPMFTLLLRLKAAQFPRPGEGPFRAEEYYSFAELRELLEYREPPAERLANAFLKGVCYLPALFMPPLLYILLLCWMLPAASGLWAPIVAVLILPAMIFAMGVLYQLISVALVRWERTRYGILRRFALASGGKRRSLTLSKESARTIKRFAAGALCCLLAALVIFLVSSLAH